jgi:hypothetical protein
MHGNAVLMECQGQGQAARTRPDNDHWVVHSIRAPDQIFDDTMQRWWSGEADPYQISTQIGLHPMPALVIIIPR